MTTSKKRFFPVIHCVSEPMVLAAVEVARVAGADGVFLVNQGGMPSSAVASLARNVAYAIGPRLLVGVNLLGATSDQLAREVNNSDIRMCWTDSAAHRSVVVDGVEFFGGVAFKYQPAVADQDLEGAIARSHDTGVDVVTTSGPATGQPARVEKVEAMASIIRRFNAFRPQQRRLALASGVSIDNVESFLPHVDDFLVGTSIESSLGVLDLERTRALADRIHAT
jgi:predicted TIM-barrel enzyme